MPKTLIKPRYNPEEKNKSQSRKLKDDTSTNLPSNLQKFKQKFLSRIGFAEYKQKNKTLSIVNYKCKNL